MSNFKYSSLFQFGNDDTDYDFISNEGITQKKLDNKNILFIEPSVIRNLTERAFSDVSHLLRPSHLKQLNNILIDKEASENDKFVALEMIKNANISAAGVLPMCQDTGTAIVLGYKGENIFTGQDDAKYISEGIYNTYQTKNLRYSQVAPIDMFNEVNTNNNLPAQIEIYSSTGSEYKFAFVQKGGGSANKSFLYQKTKSVLNRDALKSFLHEAIINIGTSACPPYHLAIVIGGMSAEFTMKTLKLASIRYLDTLPSKGNESGQALRDLEWENIILKMTQEMGIGAQFGGKYFCHDVRVIRLPRHGASCPIGIGVSCSADRQVLAKINSEGIFIEKLEKNKIKVHQGKTPFADKRFVEDLIYFNDPQGNRIELVYNPMNDTDPFKPSRPISGFKTGALGMGHAVIHVKKIDDLIPFYTEVLGFKISDYSHTPISLCFFHVNGRHHSLALFGSGRTGFHHFMVEYNSLDDVGQGYDLLQYQDNKIAYTLGRHTNDYMTSFYSITPSGFFIENGWGGRIIDPKTWEPIETFEGPSFWGHERLYLPDEERMKFRNKRLETASEGKQAPLFIDCPWLYSNTINKK